MILGGLRSVHSWEIISIGRVILTQNTRLPKLILVSLPTFFPLVRYNLIINRKLCLPLLASPIIIPAPFSPPCLKAFSRRYASVYFTVPRLYRLHCALSGT